jgi:glycosyltransferase involved in cell wall biosynthesis
MWGESGIGRYLREVLPRVVAAWPEARWRWCGFARDADALPEGERVVWELPVYHWREHFKAAPEAWRSAEMRWVPHYNVSADTCGLLVVTVHDILPLVETQGIRGQLRAWVAQRYFDRVRRNATKVVCPSWFSADGLARMVGVQPERIGVTPLGVSDVFMGGGEQAREKVWLFVGNVKPHKGLATLLKALGNQAVAATGRRVVIVGRREGFFTAAPELGILADRLGERVQWAGVVSEAELRGWYACAEALVLPSVHEGFGLPVLEAMAAGCPVIAAAAGALPEVGGEAAWCFQPGDADGLAVKLCELAGSPEKRAAMAAAGRERAAGFTWERTASLTVAVLRRAWEQAI